MRIAWFRETAIAQHPSLDETAAALSALGQTHEIDIVTPRHAHDFVWKHFRAPYDLTVFEAGLHFGASFMRPYLFHYPGAVVLSSAVPHTVHGAWMLQQARIAARLIITRDTAYAEALREELPDTPVRLVPLATSAPVPGTGSVSGYRPGTDPVPIRIAVVGAGREATAARAAQRARDAGALVTLINDPQQAEVLLALVWPGAGESLMPALAGMAAGQTVVVFEMEATAAWPALDPQTWRPRLASTGRPIVISIDPRDEEHSLALVMRRLAADRALCDTLASAAQEWWRDHATLAHALPAWNAAIDDAMAAVAPPRPAWLPDGASHARAILDELGVSVDFLQPSIRSQA